MKNTVLAVGLACLLAACGFHLRSALVLPPDIGPIRVVTSDPYSPLGQLLTRALDRAGAKATEDDNAGDAITPANGEGAAAPASPTGTARLVIRSERFASTPIAVDEFGRAQEYSLRYAVVFILRRADNSVFVPLQAIELARDYVSVPDNSTGTDTERELLTKELRKDMAASILRRIDAASRSPVLSTPPAPGETQAPAEVLPDPTATP